MFYTLAEGLNHRSIFDKSVLIKQLDVVEAHNLLIFRCDKGNRDFVVNKAVINKYQNC